MLSAVATGGRGGDGGPAGLTNGGPAIGGLGGSGGAGAQGGDAALTFSGTLNHNLTDDSPGGLFFAAIDVEANGGSGGDGGLAAGDFSANGGSGSGGGGGGSATLTFGGTLNQTDARTAASDPPDPGTALLVSAGGGSGGRGAQVNNFGLGGWGGNGGAAGSGGTATLNFASPGGGTAQVVTTTDSYNGAIAQSIGGGGGAGGNGSGIFSAGGGVGQGGGSGGHVVANATSGFLVTRGAHATGLIAQSVGGGGGVGGNATDRSIVVSQSIGGNGGSGGAGGEVDVAVGPDMVIASTGDQGGGGVLAQSIGGNGGVGGSSNTQGASLFSLGIGGTGFSGGGAGQVTVVSQGLVTTYGDHARGIQGQSVGGGGGDGGTAVVFVGGVGSSAVAIGGSGGTGGTGQTAAISSSGQVSTFGSDAIGMQAQSVGGGGGNGGAATATALALSPHPDVPAVSVSVALGGTGGSGNAGGAAAARNTGVVSTAGHVSTGVQVQSVGGGGGNGGDATASAYAFGRSEVNLTVSTAVGGRGGTGGDAGGVQAYNDGLVFTLGQDAAGLYGQSVGGGGGTGGAGDATSTTGEAANSMAVTISVGGSGAAGGTGNAVVARNTGTIGTMGDGADGIFAQSVGGGGGDGNGGVAAANAGTVTVAVGVGGSGGTGNHGGGVTARNDGVVVTTGSAAMGMVAQSVGGGGGTAGKGSTSLGGAADAITQAKTMTTSLENNFGAGQHAVEVTKGVFQVAQDVQSAWNSPDAAYKLMTGANPPGSEVPSEVAQSVSIGVSVGGSGGAGGNGGAAAATNTGHIQTHGDLSDGVWVQSVGGGGGIGGASATSQSEAETNSLNVSLGRGGGGAGDGGAVTATNATGAGIETFGDLSFGLAGQSVGGSGGRGGLSAATSKVLSGLSVAVSGTGNGGGAGGAVTVANAGSIATKGIHAIGIFAQSVGGGGGLATVSTIDTGAVSGGAGPDTETGAIFDLTVGSVGSSTTGAGGDVQVTNDGAITTTGRGGVGILAHSIGGGGGFLAGGQAELTASTFATNASQGDGGDVTVDVGGTGQGRSTIRTAGDNAHGVWALSVGGGGGASASGLSGANSIDGPPLSFLGSDLGDNHSGDGGTVEIDLSNASIETPGINSHGINAWSIGGGGGMFSGHIEGAGTTLTGSLGGAGAAGDISISLRNSTITTGLGGFGDFGGSAIHAGADGQTDGNISIGIDAASSLSAELIAIDLFEAAAATITNAGTISGRSALVYSRDSAVTLANTGTIVGRILCRETLTPCTPNAGTSAAAPVRINNGVTGLMTGAETYDLGSNGRLRNAGTLEFGEAGETDTTRIVGDLVQTGRGVLRFDLDSVGGTADHVTVSGTATLDGKFEVVATTLLPGRHEVMTAVEGVTVSDSFATSEGHVFTHHARAEDDRLSFGTTADFTTDGADTDDRTSLADHLQDVWDAGGAGLATGFAALATVEDADGYAAALDAMSAGSVAAVGYARFESSRWHAQAAGSCPDVAEASVARTDTGCMWFQMRGSGLDRDANGDDPGFDFEAVTAAVGGRADLGGGLYLGSVLSWEDSSLTDDADHISVDGSALQGSVTLTRERGPLTLSGSVSLGHGSFDSARTIAFPGTAVVARADSDVESAGLHFRAAYEIPRGTWYLEPALDIDLVHVRLGGFTESGAGEFNLDVDSSDATILAGTPWLRVGRRVDVGNGRSLDAYAALGVSLLAGEDFETTARFAGVGGAAGDFTTSIDNPNVIGRISAGVDFHATDRIRLRAQYDGGFADGQVGNAASLRVTYSF